MPRSRLKFRMNAKLRARLKREARLSGTQPERLVEQAITWYLDDKQFDAVLSLHANPEEPPVNSVFRITN